MAASGPTMDTGSISNTSFALLFLCKSNFLKDLSNKHKGNIKDPGARELRGGGASQPIFTPRAPGKIEPATGTGGKNQPQAERPALTLPSITELPEADKIANELVAATAEDWTKKLNEIRYAKGGNNTYGLVRGIAKLEGQRQKDARNALADRLTRMTAATLRTMLMSSEAELRRAAALACGMKDDKVHIVDLIERITDPQDAVVRAARASLKSLTARDFGPDSGANEEDRLTAASEWRKWQIGQSVKK